MKLFYKLNIFIRKLSKNCLRLFIQQMSFMVFEASKLMKLQFIQTGLYIITHCIILFYSTFFKNKLVKLNLRHTISFSTSILYKKCLTDKLSKKKTIFIKFEPNNIITTKIAFLTKLHTQLIQSVFKLNLLRNASID